MNAGVIVAIVLGALLGPLLLGLFIHSLVDDTAHCLWPRGLRWFPRAWDRLEDAAERAAWVLWPENRELLPVPRRIRHLEWLDEKFRFHYRLHRTWPEWTGKDDTHGYWRSLGREIATCSCGYVDECKIWCGDGHTTGQCPEQHPHWTV